MTGKLVKKEAMALAVDHGRMIQTLKRSRLADKYAYVRDLLVAAADRNANKLNIIGTPGRIVIRDNGDGIPTETLDEKLTTIFTDEDMDELASGILSSFDANVEEVLIETVPENGQPYQLSIYNEEGDVWADEPLPLEKKLSQGTRITFFKRNMLPFSLDEGILPSIRNLVQNRGVPELAKIREACKHSNMDVRVNMRRVKKNTPRKKLLVSVDTERDGITGKVGLLEEGKFLFYYKDRGNYKCARSRLHAYRKGFFHGEYNFVDNAFELPHGPLFAELNYNKLKVDIGGKRLSRDSENINRMTNAINHALPALYKKLLEAKPSEERRQHLLHYTLAHLSPINKTWQNMEYDEVPYSMIGRRGCGSRSAYGLKDILKDVHLAVLDEKLYETKDYGTVSLSFLFKQIRKGITIHIDHRGYNYDDINENSIIVRPNGPFDLTTLILRYLERTTEMQKTSPFGGEWFYRKFESQEAKRKKHARNMLEDKLKLPIIYRPIQMAGSIYDTMLFEIFNPAPDEQNYYLYLPIRGLCAAALTPFMAMGMSYAIVKGTAETALMAARPLKRLRGPVGNAARWTAEAYNEVSPKMLSGARTAGDVLSTGGKGALAVGTAVGGAAVLLGLGAVKLAVSPVVYAVKGTAAAVNYIGETYSPKVKAFLDKMEAARERRRDLRRSLQKGKRLLLMAKEDEKNRLLKEKKSDRSKESYLNERAGRKATYYRRFTGMIDRIFSHRPFSERKWRSVDKRYMKANNCYFSPISKRDDVRYGERLEVIIVEDSYEIKKLVNAAGRTDGLGNMEYYLSSLLIDEAGLAPREPERESSYLLPKKSKDSEKKKKKQIWTSDVARTLRTYHNNVLKDKLTELYQITTDRYCQGEAEEFMDVYSRLDTAAKSELLYRIMGEERQPEIDEVLEADEENVELLEEAGRKRLREEKKKRQCYQDLETNFDAGKATDFFRIYDGLMITEKAEALYQLLKDRDPEDWNGVTHTMANSRGENYQVFKNVRNLLRQEEEDFDLVIDI